MNNFQLKFNDVVDFKSTFGSNDKPMVSDRATITDQPAPKVEKSTSSLKNSEISVQTETKIELKFAHVDEEKLASWLKRILPAVEEELASGVTYIEENEDEADHLKIMKIQEIDLRKNVTMSDHGAAHAAACFLSVATIDASVFVLALSPSHETWCDHSTAFVSIYRPRSQDGSINWSEVKTIPVKACIECLATNPFNKDCFAGGTISGDLYVWCYEHVSEESIKELFCDSSQRGAIIALDWVKYNVFSNDCGLLTCHNDGFILLWRFNGKQLLKDKTFQMWNPAKRENFSLTTLCTVSSAEFIVGTINGTLLHCSTVATEAIRESDGNLSPIISEFGSQSFAISSLVKTIHDNRHFVVSADISGTIHVYDLVAGVGSSKDPVTMVKMPLPIPTTINCTKNMRTIYAPSANGELTVFRMKKAEKIIIPSTLKGNGDVLALSSNENWLISGAYEGIFQIFRIETSD